MPNITLYAVPGCPRCAEARECLRSLGVSFVEVDVRQDPLAMHQMAVYAGGPTVPVIEVDGDVLVGFDRERLEDMVKKSGEN